MKGPDLSSLLQWLGPDLLSALDERRRSRNEYRRRRKLGTTETLWLMLAVSLDTARNSLYEIVQLAVCDLEMSWTVSVSAFCQARRRFSPRQPALASRPPGGPTQSTDRFKTLERSAPAGRRSHHPDPSGKPCTVETLSIPLRQEGPRTGRRPIRLSLSSGLSRSFLFHLRQGRHFRSPTHPKLIPRLKKRRPAFDRQRFLLSEHFPEDSKTRRSFPDSGQVQPSSQSDPKARCFRLSVSNLQR